jgi:hypothetical protein
MHDQPPILPDMRSSLASGLDLHVYLEREAKGRDSDLRLRLSALASAVVLVLSACSTSSESTTTEPESVPAGWTTYSDETSGFSISYPAEWEIVQVDRDAVAELVDVDIGTAVFPLTVGLQLPDNKWDPNVNIATEALPAKIDSDQYAAATKQALVDALPNYTLSEQTKAIVGGRDSVLLHSSFPVSDLVPGVDGYSSQVMLITTEGARGWAVSCTIIGSEASADPDDLETCNSVVRTFKLSSP